MLRYLPVALYLFFKTKTKCLSNTLIRFKSSTLLSENPEVQWHDHMPEAHDPS